MHDEVLDGMLDATEPAELLLTIEQAARRLQIGRTTMCALLASGEVRSVEIGRLRRIPLECLHDYIATKLAKHPQNKAA